VTLLVAVAATALSLFLSAPQNEWLFTGEKAIPFGSEQLRWWILLLPLALGGGTIASISLIAAIRTVRDGHRLGACAALAVGVLGTVSLATAVSFGAQWRVFRQQPMPRPPRPLTWIDAYLPEQWWDLAFHLRESPLTPPHIRMGGVGVEGYPGYIPFDPFLLKRVSFVGLTPDAVASMLGPPLPREQASHGLQYSMAGGPDAVTASLYLAVENDEHGNPRVASERLDVRRGYGCGVVGVR
jgi:hypothetical protein